MEIIMSRNHLRVLSAVLVVVSLIAAACGDDADEDAEAPAAPSVTEAPAPEAPGTIVEVAVASEAFPTLVAAVQAAGLVEVLNSEGPFTVFAPTEEAFAAALDALGVTAEVLLADTELLTAVLTYHVLPLAAPAETVLTLDGQSVTTVGGADVAITIDGNIVMVNDATVVTADIEASNGVIHVIDTVLLPPVPESDDTDAPDEPEAPEMSEAEEMSESEAADESEAPESEAPGTIVEVAVASEAFPTLVAAVQAAGLVDVLNSDGPFTVFAPTEEAFAAALAALGVSAEDLLADTDLLTAVLTYHVLPVAAPAETVLTLDGQGVTTVNGADVAITIDGGTVMVNNATVVAADIGASNGVIHVIDAVLLPPAPESEDTDAVDEAENTSEPEAPAAEALGTIVEVAVASEAFPTLVAAVPAAGRVDVLSSDGPFTVFAPTEEAFAAALDALGVTAEDLLADTDLLTAVLTYHVLPLAAPAEVVLTLDGQSVATVGGADVAITIDGSIVMVNDAMVVTADIEASNGVIHVIDAVLLPPAGE